MKRSIPLHPTQEKIFALSKAADISHFSLRKIGKAIGLQKVSPQTIKYHLNQLIEIGLISAETYEPKPGGYQQAINDMQKEIGRIKIADKAVTKLMVQLAKMSDTYLKLLSNFIESIPPELIEKARQSDKK